MIILVPINICPLINIPQIIFTLCPNKNYLVLNTNESINKNDTYKFNTNKRMEYIRKGFRGK